MGVLRAGGVGTHLQGARRGHQVCGAVLQRGLPHDRGLLHDRREPHAVRRNRRQSGGPFRRRAQVRPCVHPARLRGQGRSRAPAQLAARRPPRRAVLRVRAALRRAHQDGRVRRGDGLLRAHRLQGARLDRDLRRPHRPRADGHVHGPVHDGLRRMDGPQAGRPQAYARLLHHGAGRRNIYRPRPRHVAGGGGRTVPCPEPRDHEGLALPLCGRPHFPRGQPQALRSRGPRPRNAVGRGLHEHRHRVHHGPAAVQRLREQIPHDRGLYGRRAAAHRGGAHRGEPRGGDLLHAHPAHYSA